MFIGIFQNTGFVVTPYSLAATSRVPVGFISLGIVLYYFPTKKEL